jgi:hypothetical protein
MKSETIDQRAGGYSSVVNSFYVGTLTMWACTTFISDILS